MKKGWIMNIDAKSLHLDPTLYNDPTKFMPSRFDVRLPTTTYISNN
ncbi:cytochrome P450 [Heyndrickxia coagulans]